MIAVGPRQIDKRNRGGPILHIDNPKGTYSVSSDCTASGVAGRNGSRQRELDLSHRANGGGSLRNRNHSSWRCSPLGAQTAVPAMIYRRTQVEPRCVAPFVDSVACRIANRPPVPVSGR